MTEHIKCQNLLKTLVSHSVVLNDIHEYDLSNPDSYFESFIELFNESHEKRFFWEYCSYSVYKDLFDSRLEKFQTNFADVDLEDFARKELQELNVLFCDDYVVQTADIYYEVPEHFLFKGTLYNKGKEETVTSIFCKSDHKDLFFQLKTSFDKKKAFLKSLIPDLSKPPLDLEEGSNIQFHGNNTELAELVLALISNENIKGDKNELWRKFQVMFGKNSKRELRTIKEDIKGRKGSMSAFIDSLKESLETSLFE